MVQNGDNSISAIVIQQSANHHSVTKGQVITLQAHNCTIDSNICATVSSCDSNMQQRASTLCYQMGINLQLTFMLHIENTSVLDNHKD
jgi:hypothetical protein